MIPIFIFQIWFLSLLSAGLVGGMIYLAHEWQQRSWRWDEALQRSVFAPDFGANEDTLIFAGALLLLFLILMGGSLIKAILLLACRRRHTGEPLLSDSPTPTSRQCLQRPDGSELMVEFYGRPDGIPIVLTHGWGMTSSNWNYLKHSLADRFRIVVWDEPGLGESTRPSNRDYSLENLAVDLKAVLDLTGDRASILVGHSIGGMITLTFCRLFPAELGHRIAGLVLTHTTPVDPVRTTSGAAFYRLIERPVLMPMMYVTMALSPLFRLMNWLSYRNGSAHVMTKLGSFAGHETWDQIEQVTRLQTQASPAVIARGMLGMMRYDAAKVLEDIPLPTLVVAGDRDTTTKPEASEWIHSGIPTSRLLKLTPAKHYGFLEHHDQYAVAVREFSHEALSKNLRSVGTTPKSVDPED